MNIPRRRSLFEELRIRAEDMYREGCKYSLLMEKLGPKSNKTYDLT